MLFLFATNINAQKIDSVEHKNIIELSKELIKANGFYQNCSNNKDLKNDNELSTMKRMQINLLQNGLGLKTIFLKAENAKALGNTICAKISAFNAAALINVYHDNDTKILKYLQEANNYYNQAKSFVEKNGDTKILVGTTELEISKNKLSEILKLISSVEALITKEKDEAKANYDEKKNDDNLKDLIVIFNEIKQYLDNVDEKKVAFDANKVAKYYLRTLLYANYLNRFEKYKGYSSYYSAMIFYTCALLEYELGTKDKAKDYAKKMNENYKIFKDELLAKGKIIITLDDTNYALKTEHIDALEAATKLVNNAMK
jgi:hypothetical protein